MVLADTCVWIDHFRGTEPRLTGLLNEAQVLMHPHILGELACGNLTNHKTVLRDLGALPRAVSATHEEIMNLVENRQFAGRGIGWIDAHLLASALLTNCRFWTGDERLARLAREVGVKLYPAG